MKHTFLIALAFLSLFASASPIPKYLDETLSPEKIKELAFHPQWLRLMHYQKSIFGGYRSQATGETFFFSPEGGKDPEKELAAAVQAYFDEKPNPDDHPRCRFPARYHWLESQLSLKSFESPLKVCPKYLHYLEQTGARSATVIFSSYYLNNPSSAFGHTMLRLNRADTAVPGKRFELLDFGVNYAAEVTTQNPFIYALYGVFGIFKGIFTRIPYYYKVREYNDFESRDLWEYDLNLTPDQMAVLVDHIWELGSTHFDYYYLTQNCSYHMLTTLEVALPGVDLVKHLPYAVVPADTIKIMARVPGLIRDVQFRPSLRAQFKQRLEPLNGKQTDALQALVEQDSLEVLNDGFSKLEKAQVLDAALDHFDLRNFRTLLYNPEDPAGAWRQKMLVARAQLGVQSDDLKITAPADEVPHTGHDIGRLGVEFGYGDNRDLFTSLSFRFALHDLLDPRIGYPDTAQIEFFTGKLRYHPTSGEIWPEDLTFFRITSLSPMDRFNHSLSWRARLGAGTVRDENCDHCVAGGLQFGTGVTLQPFSKLPLLTYLLASGEASLGAYQRTILKLGVGPLLGVRAVLSRNIVALVEAEYRYQFLVENQNYFNFSGELRWALSTDLALNFRSQRFPDSWENSVGLFYYF